MSIIWPPTHNDPKVKGPQPRILSRQQQAALEKMREEKQDFPDVFKGHVHGAIGPCQNGHHIQPPVQE